MTLHQNCRPFMAQINDSSVNPKMANFSNGHSSDTEPVKKQYSRLHIVTYLCQFIGQNCEIWGGQKNSTKIFGSRTFGLEAPPDAPRVLHPPPKMVPPYSLGTCPPTTPSHFDAPSLLHRENIDFLKTPDFGQST